VFSDNLIAFMHRSVIQLNKVVSYFSWMNTLGCFCITYHYNMELCAWHTLCWLPDWSYNLPFFKELHYNMM